MQQPMYAEMEMLSYIGAYYKSADIRWIEK